MFIVIICAIFALSACKNISAIQSIEIKGDEEIVVPMGEFSYEDKTVIINYANGTTEEIALSEDMIPEIERLKFFKYGDQEVKVVYDNRYATTMKIKVVRKTFEDIYQLNGYACTYDGQVHKVELNKELPEGATADYVYGNAFTNVGEYDVVCVLTKEGVESKTLRTKLIIEPAQRDESQIVFEDTTISYTGEPIAIKATNVPEGVDVSYVIYNGDIKINSAINVGTYKFVARFTDSNENYKKIEDKEAYLTISKASYNMSTVTLEDIEKTYDGQVYTPSFTQGSILPEGVSASFKCLDEDGNVVSSNVNAGVYTIVATFTGNTTNYLPIDPMEATLLVSKRVIPIENVVTFESSTVYFDRNVHAVEVQGTPSNVSVEYENNNQKYVGEYEVIAHFSATDDNYTVDIENLSAYLIINKIKEHVIIWDGDEAKEVTPDRLNFIYENEVRVGLEIQGLDTEVYVINYFAIYRQDSSIVAANEAFVDGTTYSYEIEFKFVDENENNSVILSTATGLYKYTNPSNSGS